MMTVKLMRRGALCVLTATLALHPAEDAAAQIGGGVFAYPTGGQDQQQQSKDQFECHQWSVQQSGFDPTVPQQQPQVSQQTAPPPDSSGGAVGGAARGAALGAVGGAIAGDAGKGAAIGAGVGALGGSMRRGRKQQEKAQWEAQQRQQQEQAQQQAQQQRAAGMDTYARAYSACMSARNYQVQ